MRWQLVLTGILPMVHALPQARNSSTSASASASAPSGGAPQNSSFPRPTSEDIHGATANLGGSAITDPVRVAYFDKLHDEVLEGMRNGSAVPVRRFQDPAGGDGASLDRRQGLILTLIDGFFLLFEGVQEAADIAAIEMQIAALFGFTTTEWWLTTERCRVHFQTHGGGNEQFVTYNKGSNTPVNNTAEK